MVRARTEAVSESEGERWVAVEVESVGEGQG